MTRDLEAALRDHAKDWRRQDPLYLVAIRKRGHWLGRGADRGAELKLPPKLRDLRHGGGQFDLSVR